MPVEGEISIHIVLELTIYSLQRLEFKEDNVKKEMTDIHFEFFFFSLSTVVPAVVQ